MSLTDGRLNEFLGNVSTRGERAATSVPVARNEGLTLQFGLSRTTMSERYQSMIGDETSRKCKNNTACKQWGLRVDKGIYRRNASRNVTDVVGIVGVVPLILTNILDSLLISFCHCLKGSIPRTWVTLQTHPQSLKY